MKRVILMACCLLFVLASQQGMAQFRVGERRETAATPTVPSGPTPETSDSNIRGFERAVAVQATLDQVAQFRRLRASTQAARNRTREVLHSLPTKPGNAYTLANALQEAGWENQKFLDSFTREQRSGLRKFARKMRKADSELDRHAQTLQNFDFSATSDKDILASLQKLDKTLGDLQSQQLAIAVEMGIQEATSKQQ